MITAKFDHPLSGGRCQTIHWWLANTLTTSSHFRPVFYAYGQGPVGGL